MRAEGQQIYAAAAARIGPAPAAHAKKRAR